MNYPSIKTLMRINGVDKAKAIEIRNLWLKKAKTRSYSSVQELEKQCYNTPDYDYRLETAINEIIGGFGFEALRGEYLDRFHMDIQASYCNMGDTYDMTIIHDYESGRWIVCSWDDFVESQERKGRMFA